jgi:hypothetical protein
LLPTLPANGSGVFGFSGSTTALDTTLTLATVLNDIGIGFQHGAHTRRQLVAKYNIRRLQKFASVHASVQDYFNLERTPKVGRI